MPGRASWTALRLCVAAGLAVILGTSVSAASSTVVAGPRANGTAITPLGVRVSPAGLQSQLGNLPLAAKLFPDGHRLLVANAGIKQQSLQVTETSTGKVLQTIRYPPSNGLFMGLAFSPDGTTAYASGGATGRVHVYDVAGKGLVETTPLTIPSSTGYGISFPAGLVVTADGKRLLIADHLQDSVSVVDLHTGAVQSVPVGHAPYDIVVKPNGRTAYVTNQGGNTVTVLDVSTPYPFVLTTLDVGTHPNAMALDVYGHLMVADGDSDEITFISARSNRVYARMSLSPYPNANIGTTPIALALSTNQQTLYVANAGNNDVAVVDISKRVVRGLIPTGWYPTAVVATDDHLYVTNGKGLGAGPSLAAVLAGAGRFGASSSGFVPQLMAGSLSAIHLPITSMALATYTRRVVANNRFATPTPKGRFPSPITHVIYVVQENRSYDQMMGSLGKGNGDPTLNLFGDETAANQRELQRRFVTLDNFYANAEVSAQGWNWSTSANSNPFSEAIRPVAYSGLEDAYPSESGDPAIAGNRNPADAYIWDRLAAKGISFRNYGFFVTRAADGTWAAADPLLDAQTDHSFAGFDLACPDNADTFTAMGTRCGTPRFDEWLGEFTAYDAAGTLPTVQLVRLPNDHTAGTKPSTPTPRAYVADNDYALGRLVAAVSHSRFWDSTAIFVTEDDAQSGSDHVDGHRTVTQVISPYTQTGRVDSTFYSTASVLRSIEDIVGIAPLTQFDAFASPMTRSFTQVPNLTPYDAVLPQSAWNEMNSPNSPMAAVSKAQRLDKEDLIDEATFNEAIWKSVRGAQSVMPAPHYGMFAAPAPDDDD